MSKQQGYQQQRTVAPNGEDNGLAARLLYLGVLCPTHGAHHANSGVNCNCGAAGVAPMTYPAAAYAAAATWAQWAGHPVPSPVPIVGPMGMVVPDSIGRCGRKRARRMACAAYGLAYGCHGCRGCRGYRRCRQRRGGPVHLLFSLARSALQFA